MLFYAVPHDFRSLNAYGFNGSWRDDGKILRMRKSSGNSHNKNGTM